MLIDGVCYYNPISTVLFIGTFILFRDIRNFLTTKLTFEHDVQDSRRHFITMMIEIFSNGISGTLLRTTKCNPSDAGSTPLSDESFYTILQI